jgi:Leu/Phe-tRNA-protein transferase
MFCAMLCSSSICVSVEVVEKTELIGKLLGINDREDIVAAGGETGLLL